MSVNPFVSPAKLLAIEDVAGRYTLTWDAVSGADRYEISINGDGQGRIITATGTTYVDTTVIASKKAQYVYSVSACKGTACSWKTAATLLFYPTGFTVSDLDNKVTPSVNLNWDAVTKATSYTIYRNCGKTDEKSFTATTGPIIDTAVSAQTTYGYCISACNSGVCTAKSPEVSVTTGSLYDIPVAPTGLTASVKSPFVIELNWNSVSNAEYYEVLVTDSVGYSVVQAYSMPFQITGLKKNTLYAMAVSACNARTCSDISEIVTATTLSKQTIIVDAAVSAVGLANAVPLGVSTTGSYNVSYSLGANKTSSVSNMDAYYFMSALIYSYTPATGADKIALTPVSWLTASTLSLNATDSRAIMIEAESTSDNGGFSVLTFSQAGKTPINTALAGFGNSVQLTGSNSREITNIELPAGTYSFALPSSTVMPESHDGERKFEQILLYYVSTTGFGTLKALDANTPVSITKNGGSMYAFFIDDEPGSVTGSITIEITP